jgi:chromate reductase, NAD(P)H dehydrogenase (quinone)
LDRIKLVGIVGSLRKDSLNAALMRAAAARLPRGTEIDVLGHLDELPFYNQDIEHEPHDRIDALREQVEAADGLLIATPEYNYGTPAVLKNAVDWLSRPMGKAALRGKPVAIMGASPSSFGSVRAQLALRQNLLGADARPMAKPEYILSHAKSAFDVDGEMIQETSSDQLIKFLAAFSAQIAA